LRAWRRLSLKSAFSIVIITITIITVYIRHSETNVVGAAALLQPVSQPPKTERPGSLGDDAGDQHGDDGYNSPGGGDVRGVGT